MCLLLVIVWGFGTFNSRLGGKNSRLGRYGTGRQQLDFAHRFRGRKVALSGNRRNSRFDGNNREFSLLTSSASRRRSPAPATAAGSAPCTSRCAPVWPPYPPRIAAAPPFAPRRAS